MSLLLAVLPAAVFTPPAPFQDAPCSSCRCCVQSRDSTPARSIPAPGASGGVHVERFARETSTSFTLPSIPAAVPAGIAFARARLADAPESLLQRFCILLI
jgi:hypothetical protein